MLHFCPMFLRHSPAIPEMDFSGTIVAIGPEKEQRSGFVQEETDALIDRVSERGLVLGAEVFGSVLVPEHIGGGHGSLAEYILVDSSCLVKRPLNAKMEEVAGLGVAGCTALVLVEKAELKRGDSVLVNGASGGIGTMVVQLVKRIVGDNGKVVGVCSEKNAESVRNLGTDEVSLNLLQGEYTVNARIRSLPMILMRRWGSTWPKSLAALGSTLSSMQLVFKTFGKRQHPS